MASSVTGLTRSRKAAQNSHIVKSVLATNVCSDWYAVYNSSLCDHGSLITTHRKLPLGWELTTQSARSLLVAAKRHI